MQLNIFSVVLRYGYGTHMWDVSVTKLMNSNIKSISKPLADANDTHEQSNQPLEAFLKVHWYKLVAKIPRYSCYQKPS